ncbi:MAG: hypothetical protein OEO20_04280 [Gemmatimonadota bacterium]|nr:hypothetical protein [Gemmatimonadota bacterium]MDH3367828.1 hypothetical protein [Gemmatimonadota bacterium]MDH3477504.1 hypothetical protein [Gemmatimonadota bacterium]MDH3569013.1 hypothetical protein [Gemmatimonadota bacterium]MDH5549147.1 hypothetical protein [Gemmatimonadota bacterium]
MTVHQLSATELTERLRTERILAVAAEAWHALADQFDEIERHATGIAGDLVIIRTPAGLAAVEQPNSTQRVMRLLTGDIEVRQFVRQRTEQYERMWDGCGCKVDYYT